MIHSKRIFNTFLLCFSLLILPLAMSAQTEEECQQITLNAIETAKAEKYSEAFELLMQAREMADKNNWTGQKILALNAMGITYNLMKEYGDALNYYLEAYKLALKEKDPRYRALVVGNIGRVYAKEKKYKEAEEYLLEVYELYKDKNNLENMGNACLSLGTLYNETNRLDEARKYLNDAQRFIKDREFMKLVHYALAENDLLRGNTIAARVKAEELFEKYKDKKEYIDPSTFLLIAAKAYKQEQNFDKAIATCKKILANKPDLEDKLEAFKLLSEMFHIEKRHEKAFIYKDSAQKTEYKLADLKNSHLFENSIVKLQVENYKNELVIKDQKLQGERRVYFSILIVILAVVTVVILILRQKKLTVQRNNLLLEKKIREKDREQEQLQKEIEVRNRKLSAKALYVSDRNQFIDSLVTSLESNQEIGTVSSISIQIKALKEHLRVDNDWETFVAHFEEVNPGFLQRLKKLHPALTSNDMRYIAYTYMNLTAKEIANLLNITLHASKKRKERICIKMELQNDTGLYSYLSSI